ncbi:MAG: DNA alkylation repair protein [Nanoarchaeota archaeon]
MLSNIKKELRTFRDPGKAMILSSFFKTGRGQYGEGDFFLGISVPEQRRLAKKYINLQLIDIRELLKNKIHEYRLTSLLILVEKYNKGSQTIKQEIFDFYLSNLKYVNNWDLVDLTADKIVGSYLFDRDKSILYELSKSQNVWERRISVIATFHFIKNNQFDDTLRISEMLLNDKHDLIHKAVGWMLREIGKRNQEVEEDFLKKHHKKMPRTMLRYAIERFDEKNREFYLKK